MENDRRKTIVLIDDDFVIRDVIRRLLGEFKVYSTDNGVEGLGYIYISKPSLIIIDTTLPKYGGLEVVDYIANNEALKGKNIPILVIHEEDKPPTINYSNVKYLLKGDRNFIQKFCEEVSSLTSFKKIEITKLNSFFGNVLVRFANLSDRVQRRIEVTRNHDNEHFLGTKVERREMKLSRIPASNFFRWIYWLGLQIVISILLTLYTIFAGRPSRDENLPQLASDSSRFRVRYYPTLITAAVSVIFLCFQVFLFVTGGIVIFNTRIESIFAVSQSEVAVDFYQSIYDPNEINFNGSSFSLILKSETITPEVVEEEIVEEEIPPSEPSQDAEVIDENANQNNEQEEVVEISPEPEVLGADVRTYYSNQRSFVVFNQGVEYSSIESIKEESSLNTKETSLGSSESQNMLFKTRSDDDLLNLSSIHTQILNEKGELLTYQLSPNGNEWYYVGSEQNWEVTTQGYVSSNTVQEVNQFIDKFNLKFPDSELFIKVFFHSLGEKTPILNRLFVDRGGYVEGELVEDLGSEEGVEILDLENIDLSPLSSPITELDQETTPISLDLPVPTLFQVSYINREKIVYGKVSGVEIPNNLSGSLNVRAYYTNSTDISTNATDKLELIGESNITQNSRGEYTFTIREASRQGGFITVELVYQSGDTLISSQLSRPMGE